MFLAINAINNCMFVCVSTCIICQPAYLYTHIRTDPCGHTHVQTNSLTRALVHLHTHECMTACTHRLLRHK